MTGELKDQRRPEIVRPNKLLVPDISFLTGVALPGSIDMRDQNSVLSLVAQLVREEQLLNPCYAGMFIHGSLSRAQANNGSDIDGIHVIQGTDPEKTDYVYAWPIQHRLRAIFELCYGIPIQDNRFVINIGNVDSIRHGTEEFDRHTIAIGISEGHVELINGITRYKEREIYSGPRPYKFPSRESRPHHYQYPSDGIFPWYVEYGLLERIYAE